MTEVQTTNTRRFINTLENLHGRWRGMFLRDGQLVSESNDERGKLQYVLLVIPLAPDARTDEVERAIKAHFPSYFSQGRVIAISFLSRNAAVGIYFTPEMLVFSDTLRAVRQRVQDSDAPKTVFYPVGAISSDVGGARV